MEAWHHGLLNNFPPPILTAQQYLDIEEVIQLLPPLASASFFSALPYAPPDTVQHRVWSVLQADTKYPARNTFFSGSELQSLLAGPMRASVLRDSHFYPFLISTAPVLEWTMSAIEELVERFFPFPDEPPLPAPDLSQRPPPIVDISATPPQECCQWWAPLVIQVGDFRLWLSPTHRQRSQRFALGDVTSLAEHVLSGHIPVSCSIRASSFLSSATCRPDGSCGLQMACLIALLDNSTPPFPPHQWYFQDPHKRFQFRQALTNWLLVDGLSTTTRDKIQGTIHWYDNGSHGLLPPEHWFSHQDIQNVTNADWDVALWTQLGAPDRDDWSLFDGTTRSSRQHDHLSWTDLQHYLQPQRLQCGLSRSHFSPWYCPEDVTSSLPWALQALLEELAAQPLPVQGAQGSFTRITSRLRSSVPPEVLVLHRDRPLPTIPVPSPSPMEPSVSSDYASPLLIDLTTDSVQHIPSASLLHLPGRPLTLADFPLSQTLPDVDLPSSPPEGGTPYQRRFPPQPLILPIDQTRCSNRHLAVRLGAEVDQP